MRHPKQLQQLFLTVLGIVIGIVSVVTIVDISQGIKRQVSGQINNFGKDLITIHPGQLNTTSGANLLQNLNIFTPFASVSSLTNKDVKTVQNTYGVDVATPITTLSGTVNVSGKNSNVLVIGAGDKLPSLLNHAIAYGSYFDNTNNSSNVAVIGPNLATSLFGEAVPLGRSFSFHGQNFIVLGMFNQFESAPLSLNADYNNAIFIPFSTSQNLTGNSAAIDEILAKPVDPADVYSVSNDINKNLLAAHGGQQDFTVLRQDQTLAVTSKILNLFTEMVLVIALIALIVGGVGIMNITFVSVTERTHEIGIRKAIGATNSQILSQFVVEASILSVTGALIGIVLSLLVDYLLRVLTNLEPVITWQIYVVATLISICIGIIFVLILKHFWYYYGKHFF